MSEVTTHGPSVEHIEVEEWEGERARKKSRREADWLRLAIDFGYIKPGNRAPREMRWRMRMDNIRRRQRRPMQRGLAISFSPTERACFGLLFAGLFIYCILQMPWWGALPISLLIPMISFSFYFNVRDIKRAEAKS